MSSLPGKPDRRRGLNKRLACLEPAAMKTDRVIVEHSCPPVLIYTNRSLFTQHQSHFDPKMPNGAADKPKALTADVGFIRVVG